MQEKFKKYYLGSLYPTSTEIFKKIKNDKTLLNNLLSFHYTSIVVFKGTGDKGTVYEIKKLLENL